MLKDDRDLWAEQLLALENIVRRRWSEEVFSDLCEAVYAGKIRISLSDEFVSHYLIGAAKYIALRRIRATKQQFRRELKVTNHCEQAVQLPISKRLIDAEDRLLLHQAIAQMPASLRHCLFAFHIQEMSQAEIALMLGVSENTVKKRVARGRCWLTNRLVTTSAA